MTLSAILYAALVLVGGFYMLTLFVRLFMYLHVRTKSLLIALAGTGVVAAGFFALIARPLLGIQLF